MSARASVPTHTLSAASNWLPTMIVHWPGSGRSRPSRPSARGAGRSRPRRASLALGQRVDAVMQQLPGDAVMQRIERGVDDVGRDADRAPSTDGRRSGIDSYSRSGQCDRDA